SISDDGSAIVARIDEALYWRRLDEFDLRPVPRSSRSTGWVVSPDGDGLLFHVSMDEIIRRGELRRWSAENGNTVTIRETDRMLAPLEWGERGLVARAGQTSIARFETLDTPVDRMERLFETTTWTRRVETAVRVPDSDRWIVGIFPVGGERPELVIATPGDDESPLLADAARPRIAPGGRLLFLQDDTLMAIAFDRSALRVAGDRIPLIAGVVDYDLSRDGTLVYLPSSGERTARRVVRVERDGSTSVLVAGGHNYVHARLSPDGRYVSTVDPQLRLHEIATGSTRLLEFAAAGATGADHVWTPDGRFVVYTAFLVDGDKRRCVLYRQAVDGRTPPEALIEPEGDDEVYPTDYAPDGSGLVYALYRDQTDLWFQPADGSPPRAILATATSEDLGRFSPDMRWLAYESNEGGTQEVWIAAYSKADRRLGAKWRVSSGGKDPIWSPRGDELFYEDLDGRLIAVALSAGDGGVALGESSALFDLRELRIRSSGDQSYDVDPSGRSFIMVTSDRPEVREVRMVSGWLAELDRLAPPAR
ncbi:MAG TPA: hypothetical protein VD788_14615, partial [Candidatus Polarisedimenticolaceae bacterium]|nr:hypothetical protein [Candidatus Polarisedimenticolaceae bacterium]